MKCGLLECSKGITTNFYNNKQIFGIFPNTCKCFTVKDKSMKISNFLESNGYLKKDSWHLYSLPTIYSTSSSTIISTKTTLFFILMQESLFGSLTADNCTIHGQHFKLFYFSWRTLVVILQNVQIYILWMSVNKDYSWSRLYQFQTICESLAIKDP